MLAEQFRSVTGHPPAEHQRLCAEALSAGRSVILRAPTGSGKSEAVWLPFLYLRGERFPMRMIHALPMRALANQLEGRMKNYAGSALRVAAMHGQRPESVLFYADAIFATLDQVVTSYACAPLSLSVRQGNIPAGAIPGSFLVFDEVHTFEPELGLQSVLVMADRAHQMGMPFVIMSATLPKKFISALATRLDAAEVNGTRLEIEGEEPRRVTLHLQDELTADAVVDRAQKAERTIVVVNTVQRAIDLYEQVRKRFTCPVVLAHSRFYDDDRKTKEQQIDALFGKKAAKGRCLLIATQVVEVGLDISCGLLLTELAPIDALVQRAGRCARWGGKGEVVVFTKPKTKRPYQNDNANATGLVDETLAALQKENADGKELTWEFETQLVDRVLDPHFEPWSDSEAAGRVLASLADAAFSGSPHKAEKAVRDALQLEVALHKNPDDLGASVLTLPRCRLHPGVFSKFVKEKKPYVWQVVVDRKPTDDWKPQVECRRLAANDKTWMPGGYFVLHPDKCRYDSEFGLRLCGCGESAQPLLMKTRNQETLKWKLGLEYWPDHVEKVVKAFDEYVLPKEQVAFDKLASWLPVPADKLKLIVTLVLIFHDLGKLTREWQRVIQKGLQLKPGSFLAHRGEGVTERLPAHATVSAWVASRCLCRVSGMECKETLAVPALAAIAHHHSVHADTTPEFELADGWFDLIARCVRQHASIEVEWDDFNPKARASGFCGVGVNFLVPDRYSPYALFSRWLRLADRIATAGTENAILGYEEWHWR